MPPQSSRHYKLPLQNVGKKLADQLADIALPKLLLVKYQYNIAEYASIKHHIMEERILWRSHQLTEEILLSLFLKGTHSRHAAAAGGLRAAAECVQNSFGTLRIVGSSRTGTLPAVLLKLFKA
nr:hypothetical protein Iba_chr03bCG17580 [Ipomoea batatas]